MNKKTILQKVALLDDNTFLKKMNDWLKNKQKEKPPVNIKK